MTLVEKMAARMAKENGDVDWDDIPERSDTPDYSREDYRVLARAALAVILEAMREPSGAMIDATDPTMRELRRDLLTGGEAVLVSWRAMLAQFEKEQLGD